MSGFHYFMLGIGGLAILCGILIAIQRVRTMVSGASVEGTVVGEKTGSSVRSHGKAIPMSHAIVEFKHEGKTYRCESSFGQKTRIPDGTKLKVRYLQSDPKNTAEVASFPAMWGFPLIALFVGAVFIAVALYDAGFLKPSGS